MIVESLALPTVTLLIFVCLWLAIWIRILKADLKYVEKELKSSRENWKHVIETKGRFEDRLGTIKNDIRDLMVRLKEINDK